MSQEIEYASFIIRLWRRIGLDKLGNPYKWQCEVRHIQKDQNWNFASLEELQAFLFQEVKCLNRFIRIETDQEPDDANEI